MSYNRAKSSNEPQSAEKLTEELQKCVELQEAMPRPTRKWTDCSFF
jgi:hypothetical protein